MRLARVTLLVRLIVVHRKPFITIHELHYSPYTYYTKFGLQVDFEHAMLRDGSSEGVLYEEKNLTRAPPLLTLYPETW